MRAEIGDYLITTDHMQFILSVKKQKSPRKKAGTPDNYKPVGYYTHFDGAIKAAVEHTLLDNDELEVIIKKLDHMSGQIADIKEQLEYIKGEMCSAR